MRRWVCLCLALCMLLSMTVTAEEMNGPIFDIESGETAETVADFVPAAEASALEIKAKSAILMDIASGSVLYEQNAREPLPIASVTKVMTLLLVMEAIDNGQIAYEDMVTVSARAASMGGSQIWLEENEQMSVEDMVKAAAIVSANDACAALAEHIYGTLEAFVAAMNTRAAELGAENTRFVDCSGLDDAGVSSAYDIALMSSALMKHHPDIMRFTTVWMDSLRGGESELVNTNRLIRFYNGATGLKTGTTAAAGCCLSATAERDGLSLCAVVLGADSSDDRFGGARNMLDYGFANFAMYTPSVEQQPPVTVLHGTRSEVEATLPNMVGFPVEKGTISRMKVRTEIAADVEAPVEAGQVLGEVIVYTDSEELARYPLKAACAVERMTFARAFMRYFAAMTVGTVR